MPVESRRTKEAPMTLGLSVEQLLEMRGKPVFDKTGEKIGSIEDIYIDDRTREPEWVGLGTGFLGMKHAIVPLADASARDEGIEVPYEKDMVKGAPDIADDEDISSEQESELAKYYGIRISSTGMATGNGGSSGAPVPSPPSTEPMTTIPGAADAPRTADAGRRGMHKYTEISDEGRGRP
jgi:sporulation protein YlmC with PRC-barrel domain